MEHEIGVQVASFESISQDSSILQHQFFPPGCDDTQERKSLSPIDFTNERWVAPSLERRTARSLEIREPHGDINHWDVGAWNWDSMLFLAQPSSERGLGETLIGNSMDEHQEIETNVLKSSRNCTMASGLASFSYRDLREDSVLGKETVLENESGVPVSTDAANQGKLDDEYLNDVEGLTLNLGGHSYSYSEGAANHAQNSKRCRVVPSGVQQPTCLVDGCQADLSSAKDYFRRHKVCEDHSKASQASVGRLLQRFCQQCSRFHLLEEFDEGKRSCRRRLAGHNKRRRKTQPKGVAAQGCTFTGEDCASNSAGVLSLLNVLLHLQGDSSGRMNGHMSERELLVEYVMTAIRASLMTNFDCNKSGGGIMNNADSRHKAAVTEQGSPLNLTHGPINGNGTSSHVITSSNPALESLALLLKGHLNGQVSSLTGSVQETPIVHFTPNQHESHPCVDASPFQNSSMEGANTSDIPQLGNLVSSSALHSERAVEASGLLSPTWLESGCSVGACGGPQHVSANPSQSSISILGQICSPGGVLRENVSRNLDVTINRSTDTTALCLNGGFTSASISRTDLVEERLDSHYASTSQQGFPASNTQSKSILSSASERRKFCSEYSSGNAYSDKQDCTGRISFKLFDRSPKDFPHFLRQQIFEWLSQVPTEMESYIRPGCVVLTVYLSMSVKMWEELCETLHSSLKRLLEICNSDFWCKGRILVQVQHLIAYIVDGEIQESGLAGPARAEILSVRPLAVVAGQLSNVVLGGHNLTAAHTRVLCAYQGKYACQSSGWLKHDQGQRNDTLISKILKGAGIPYEELSVSFSGGHSNAFGRCFIEVEDENVGGGFLPLIVADDEICAELRTLEDEIESVSLRAAYVAMENGVCAEEVAGLVTAARLSRETEVTSFLHDLGWIFQKAYWKMNESCGRKPVQFESSAAPIKRVLIYAVDHDWCAMTRRLLDILFGIDTEPSYLPFTKASSIIEEVNLLHIAVRRICRPMVELLLTYGVIQQDAPGYCGSQGTSAVGESRACTQKRKKLIFTPDVAGPAMSTPLHVAAIMKDAENIIDALTSDPLKIGLHVWNYVKDAAGQTPFSCALAQGNFSYIQIVWRKLAQRAISGQVTINIPSDSLSSMPLGSSGPGDSNPLTKAATQNMVPAVRTLEDSRYSGRQSKLTQWGTLQLEKPYMFPFTQRQCAQRARVDKLGVKGRLYKPFLLSLVAIGAVCVCVGLLMKGPPSMERNLSPFVWESLRFGPR